MENDIREFAKLFYEAYYHREHDKLFTMLNSKAVWSGFHVEKAIVGIEAIIPFLENLQKEQGETERRAEDMEMEMEIIPLANQMYIVETKCWVRMMAKNHDDIMMPFYNSLIIDTRKELNILHVYFSVYTLKNAYDKTFLNSIQTMDMEQMKTYILEHMKALEEVNKNIKTLYNTVPGGIFKCLNDKDLTLLETSNGFLDMIGYTREEVRDNLQSSLKALIEPHDLEKTYVEVQEQLKISRNKEIQYRLIHKDGHLINVLDKGQLVTDEHGVDCFHCIVVDITREKQIEEELNLNLERYKIIMDQTNDILFEWDLVHNTFIVSNNWEKKFKQRYWDTNIGMIDVIKDAKSFIYQSDTYKLLAELEKLQCNKPYAECEIRILNNKDVYIWTRLRMTAQYDDKHERPIKVIGVMIDIDQEKCHSESLRKKAERDALTGLYNKVTTQELIEEELNKTQGRMGAFLLIDIDDFKEVNDRYGHLFGDAVLNELSQAMQTSFTKKDIIGRVGGDEFIVFIRNTNELALIEKAVQDLMLKLKTMRVVHNEKKDISCSVGIAFCPKDGSTFVSLFQNADYALYQSKMLGKNQYTFYDEEKMHQYLTNQKTSYTSTVSEHIDSNEAAGNLQGEFEKYVFEILYHTENTRNAISTILDIIGIKFNVSRVYLFENSDDDSYCTNTFEWCNDGVIPQIAELQKVSYEELGNYQENFNEERIFYCADVTKLPTSQYEILAPQGIKSMLQCAITDNGVFRGYVGFDECRQNRYWTQEQIDALVFISKIISTFLLKRRAEEQIRMQNENLMVMLDNQTTFTYVIEPLTYHLLFVNKATMKITPTVQLGIPCHKAFMDCSQPCDTCPITAITKSNPNNTVEFFNEKLGVWVDADATLITWEHKDAYLLSCHDITKYKK